MDQPNPLTMPRWTLRSRLIDEAVVAADQFAAWNTLRARPADDFGLIVTAEPNGNGDPIAIHTAALMFKWGRDDEAHAFIEVAVGAGLPDTTEADMRTAGR